MKPRNGKNIFWPFAFLQLHPLVVSNMLVISLYIQSRRESFNFGWLASYLLYSEVLCRSLPEGWLEKWAEHALSAWHCRGRDIQACKIFHVLGLCIGRRWISAGHVTSELLNSIVACSACGKFPAIKSKMVTWHFDVSSNAQIAKQH